MTDTPEDWVLIEAAKRVGWGCGVLLGANTYSNSDTKGRIFRALCDMIQKYEQPPVDLISQCAIAVCGDHDAIGRVKCVRAIEMYLERLNAERSTN